MDNVRCRQIRFVIRVHHFTLPISVVIETHKENRLDQCLRNESCSSSPHVLLHRLCAPLWKRFCARVKCSLTSGNYYAFFNFFYFLKYNTQAVSKTYHTEKQNLLCLITSMKNNKHLETSTRTSCQK